MAKKKSVRKKVAKKKTDKKKKAAAKKSVNSENRLTKEIAELFLTGEDSVDLGEFTDLDDDAAESLSKHEGLLGLDGLFVRKRLASNDATYVY